MQRREFLRFSGLASAGLVLPSSITSALAQGMPSEGWKLYEVTTRVEVLKPAGVLVWHSTRMDEAGQLALARLDASLGERWKTVLPLSETGTLNPVRYWTLPGHVVVVGDWQNEVDYVTGRVPHLVSVAIADGKLAAWNLHTGAPVE